MSHTDRTPGSNRWEVGASMDRAGIIAASHGEQRIEKASRVTYAGLERRLHRVEITGVESHPRFVRPGNADDYEG